MATNFVQPGKALPIIAAAVLTSGQAFLVGSRLAVAMGDIANGAEGEAAFEGVWNITCLGTDVITQGAPLYWDDTNKRLTLTSTSNTPAGFAAGASANGVTTVDIKLNA